MFPQFQSLLIRFTSFLLISLLPCLMPLFLLPCQPQMSTRVSQQGGVAFSRDPKALGKDTPSPWIQAATGISVLAPQLTNRRRNLPPPNQTGMQQLPPAALQQQMQMQRPNTAPGATSQLTATMQQQKPPLRRSMSSMRKDQCSGHKAIAAVLAAREHAPEDHREHGEWVRETQASSIPVLVGSHASFFHPPRLLPRRDCVSYVENREKMLCYVFPRSRSQLPSHSNCFC